MVSNRICDAIPLSAKNPDIKTGFLKRFPIDFNLRQNIGEDSMHTTDSQSLGDPEHLFSVSRKSPENLSHPHHYA